MCKYAIPLACHYPDLGSGSEWLKISFTALVPRMSFHEETSGDVMKHQLF